MKKTTITLFLLSVSTFAFSQTGKLTGSVVDGKTGEPLPGASVSLEGTTTGSSTDTSGQFVIKDIKPASYNIICTFIGYQPSIQYNVVIRSEGNIPLLFKLEENAYELGEVVVTASPFKKLEETPLSIQQLSQQEIVSYPGGNNDIAKVVQSLPGVSGSVAGFRNDIIVRGGAPNENVYYLDDIEIPNINHFSTQGSAGGPVSLLNVSFINAVTLTASAFGSQYDNVLSGSLQFDQRNGNNQNFAGNFRLSSSEAALTAEGPLSKRVNGKAKTTYIVSARRSYLQLLFKAIGLPFLPSYWDYQYKINHEINEHNTLYVTGIGSIDDFNVNELDSYNPEQQANQDQVPIIKQQTNTIGIGWKKRFKDNTGFLMTAISNNFLNNNFKQYKDNINETGLYFQNDSREMETRLRSTLTKFVANWTLSSGIVIINANYRNQTKDLINTRSFYTNLNFYRYGLFAQASMRSRNDRFSFSAGLRTDGNTLTSNGNNIGKQLSPRVSASYQLRADGKWTASASVGRYYKILPYTTLGYQNNTGEFINKTTSYIKSDHFTLGIEYLLNQKSRITAEGFLKQYDDYPVSITDNISMANKGGGFEVLGSEPINSIGKGRTYGVELLYQQKFTGKLYAIAALTFYKSEFTDGDTEAYRPAVWDNGILMSLLGGYKFNNNWEVSSRFRYLGKAPYAPVDQNATLNNYPAIVYDYSQLGSVRLDPFMQLDVRVDKKWSFKKWSLDIFLDIQNALKQVQPEAPKYGLDRTDNGDIVEPKQLVQVNSNNEGNILPSLGVVVNF